MENTEDIEIESLNKTTVENSNGKTQENKIDDVSIAELAKELEESNTLMHEYLDQFQRLQAEFENYRKRVEREKQEFINYFNASFVSELIDIMENLERGIISTKESEDKDSIVKGIEMVYRQLKKILESKGLIPIEAAGQKFDPYLHEAMMKTPTDEYPNNTVIEEFQRGYKVKDKVVRFSKVNVSVNKKNSK
jgi:molecular chaperone GrpE